MSGLWLRVVGRSRGTMVFSAAACVLSVVVAACTVGGGGSSGGSSKGTLVVEEWTNPPAIDFTKQLNAEFEKEHPGVTVKLQDAPTANNAWTTLTNNLLQSKSVDVLAQYAPTPAGFPPAYTGLKPGGTAALITSHQLTDLTNEPFMKNYDMAGQKWAVGYRGHVYGVWAASYDGAGALWYKKDLLAKYHMSIPTTFNEFIADCKKFKSHGITPIFVAGKDDLQAQAFQGILIQLQVQGHPSSDAPKLAAQRAEAFWRGSQNWTDPLYRQTADRYEQVMKYIEPAAGGVSQLTAPGIWAAKADDFPFFIDGSWDGHTIQQANPKLHFGFFTLPGADDPAANRAITYADLTWVVPAWAKHKQLALDWLKLFSKPENYKKWLQVTGSFSTQPGQRAKGLPWMDWLNAHTATAVHGALITWVPTGAAAEASLPDLTKMVPFGKMSVDDALAASAHAYSKARGKK